MKQTIARNSVLTDRAKIFRLQRRLDRNHLITHPMLLRSEDRSSRRRCSTMTTKMNNRPPHGPFSSLVRSMRCRKRYRRDHHSSSETMLALCMPKIDRPLNTRLSRTASPLSFHKRTLRQLRKSRAAPRTSSHFSHRLREPTLSGAK